MKNSILSITGALLIFVGIFMPIYSIPFLGSVTFLKNSGTASIILAGATAASIVLSFLNKQKLVLLTGTTGIFAILYPMWRLISKMNEIKKELGSNIFGSMASEVIKIEAGFPILLIGAGIVIISSMLFKRKYETAEESEEL